jgi:hypothetical protein
VSSCWNFFGITLRLRSFINVWDQVSHPHKTTGKILVLCVLIFIFLDSKLEDKRFCAEWQQAFPDFNLFLISSWIEFWFFKVVPRAAFYPREWPGIHCTGGLVGPRAGLDRCEKSRPPTGIRSPDRPARSQSLYRLSYRAHSRWLYPALNYSPAGLEEVHKFKYLAAYVTHAARRSLLHVNLSRFGVSF